MNAPFTLQPTQVQMVHFDFYSLRIPTFLREVTFNHLRIVSRMQLFALFIRRAPEMEECTATLHFKCVLSSQKIMGP